jgi:UDP-N-acetylmuramate--alanine ligase
VIAGADDAGVGRVLEAVKRARQTDRRTHGQTDRNIWRFGLAADADLRITDIEQDAGFSRANVSLPGGKKVKLQLQVPGVHNLRNATAVLGVALALKAPLEPVLDALAKYRGLGRRFERLGEVRGIEFVDDYAHHPTELVATLAAARQAFPGRRLVAVFQPHLFSRTAEHGRAMGQALAMADVAIVTEIYAAREKPMPGVTGRTVADVAAEAPSGARVLFEPDRSKVRDLVLAEARSGDVVITLGAGDITRVGRELVAWLRAA